MIEQGNAAKAERNGSRGAGAGVSAPGPSSEKSDRPGRLSRAIRPPAHNQDRVAVALVGARSRRRRPACLAAAVTRLLLWTAPHPALRANGVPALRATPLEKSDPLGRFARANRPSTQNQEESRRSPCGWCPLPTNPHRRTAVPPAVTRFLSGAAARALVPASRVPVTRATRATGTAVNRARGPVPPLVGRASAQACRHPRSAGQHRVIRLV
jgi:hypothetical protein